MKPLTDGQQCFVVNALRVAAETYRADGNRCCELYQQFKRQAIRAEKLADEIEQAEEVLLK